MKKLLPTILIFFVPILSWGQISPTLSAKADSLIEAFVGSKQLPGMSVSVSKNGELIYSKGFGYSDMETQTSVNPAETKFRIGSVSKTLTAAALGELMEDDKLDPDAEIQTYVADFPTKRWPISVRQVAGHTAGIRHYRGLEFMSDKLYKTVDEGLDIFEDDSLLFEPGTQYSYSSYGYNLISAVVEGASGEEFLPFIQREVFAALDMRNTVPEWSNREIPNLTTYYVFNGDSNEVAPFVDNSYKWAGGGFVGTTEDLIKFGEAYLDYNYQPEEVHQELMTAQTLRNGESTNYGMAWVTLPHNGDTWYGHSGGSVGGTTMFVINKEHDMVIALTINRSSAGIDGIHFDIADVFLEE